MDSARRVVSGLPDVLDALNMFLARDLYVSDTIERAGFLCREHHFLALEEGSCPFDGSALIPVEDVVDEAIEVARRQGVAVLIVEQRQDLLEPYSGFAAVTYTAPAETT
jgi:peptide subunit release factor 1 (eRF1)